MSSVLLVLISQVKSTLMFKIIFQNISNLHPENGIDDCESTRTYNFDASSLHLKRSISACWMRWHNHLLPILKTYNLGSSSFPTDYFHWRKKLIYYIHDNCIETAEDIDYKHVMKEVCPGQTFHSLKTFVRSITSYQPRKKNVYDDDGNRTFQQEVQRWINSPKLLGENNDKTKKGIGRIKAIVHMYEKIIKENK